MTGSEEFAPDVYMRQLLYRILETQDTILALIYLTNQVDFGNLASP